MTNKRDTLGRELQEDESRLTTMQEEQHALESQPTHAGFPDASRRIKLVYEGDALRESIRKERERLSDGHLVR